MQKWFLKHNNNLLDAFVFLIFSIFIFVLSTRMDGFGENILSPGTFPAFSAGVLFCLSLCLFYTGIRHTTPAEEAETTSKTRWGSVLIVTTLCLIYILALPLLHFVPSTIVFLALFLFYIGERRIWMVATVSITTTLLIYFTFGKMLKVLLP